jgi:hypothetical protein
LVECFKVGHNIGEVDLNCVYCDYAKVTAKQCGTTFLFC